MIRRAEVGGLAGLPHQIDEVSLESGRVRDGLRNAVHQQVRDHAGEERSRAQGDQIGIGDGVQRFGERLGPARPQCDAFDARQCCG